MQGDGTSTTINYLLGHPLVSARVPQKRRPVVDVDLGALSAAGKSGLALIGHNDYRQTLVPEAVHEPRIPCTVVDTAGFMISDSRGINQKLVTAFALAEAAQYFPAVISAICYVIDYSSFEPARFKTLNLCEEIDSSIRQLLGNCAQVPWKLNPRIFYLINKLPGDLTDKEFEGELKELAEDVQRAHGGRQGVKDFRVEMQAAGAECAQNRRRRAASICGEAGRRRQAEYSSYTRECNRECNREYSTMLHQAQMAGSSASVSSRYHCMHSTRLP